MSKTRRAMRGFVAGERLEGQRRQGFGFGIVRDLKNRGAETLGLPLRYPTIPAPTQRQETKGLLLLGSGLLGGWLLGGWLLGSNLLGSWLLCWCGFFLSGHSSHLPSVAFPTRMSL